MLDCIGQWIIVLAYDVLVERKSEDEERRSSKRKRAQSLEDMDMSDDDKDNIVVMPKLATSKSNQDHTYTLSVADL